MIKIAHVREVEALRGLPSEVVNVIREAVTILDTEYGKNRDVDSGYGGYVLVIDNEGELKRLQDFHMDLETVIPEYVDVVTCDYGQVFASCLILKGNDFGVLLVMPFLLLTENLKLVI